MQVAEFSSRDGGEQRPRTITVGPFEMPSRVKGYLVTSHPLRHLHMSSTAEPEACILRAFGLPQAFV